MVPTFHVTLAQLARLAPSQPPTPQPATVSRADAETARDLREWQANEIAAPRNERF